METNRDNLVRLQATLERQRQRILTSHAAYPGSDRVPAHVIRELADIDLAARAVAAELTRHTPRLGYGSVT